MSHKLIRVIKDLYVKANVVVKNNDGLSDPCEIKLGVLQGETLSPTLFSLFLHDFFC